MTNTTVLIVEDEAIVAADLAGKLGQLGYEVVGTAARGVEAVELACSLLPQVVLMDIRLKGAMDGIDAAEAIGRRIDLPVIYLTAHSDSATLERAKLSGPFGYILKPFEERELATTIEMALHKHQLDRQLREQREWLRVTLTSIGDAVITCDTDGRVTFLNPVAETLTGWTTAEAHARPIREVFCLNDGQSCQLSEDPVALVSLDGRPKYLDNLTTLVTRDGRKIPIEDSAAPILDATGRTIGTVLVFQDVTEKRRAEERIQRHITVMHGINMVFQDSMSCHTEEELGGRCLAVAEEITGSRFGFIGEIGQDGWLHDIVISNPGWDACTMIDQSGHRRPPGNFKIHGIYGRVLADGKGFFTNDPANHPDSIGLPPGHPQLKSFLGVPLIREGRTYGMIAVGNREGGYDRNDLESLEALAPVVAEVFLRKKAEVAVKERDGRLRHAEEMAHLGHWRCDLATGRVSWSDEMYRIFGLQQEAGPSDHPLDEITKFCHPDDLEQCVRSFDPSVRHDGSAFEYRIIRTDGEERHVVSKGEPVRDDYDTLVAIFGTLLDTTELRRKERELQEKNAELERFTYMISHDLKSPLVTFKTFLGYLDRDMANSEAGLIEKDLHYMRTAADRMERLLNELLEMSRVGRMVNQPLAVTCGEVVEEALNLVAGSIAEGGVELEVEVPEISLFGDRPRLVEIWQNLVENACKFMGDQAHPRIEIGAEGSGRGTVFFVRDNGVGIEVQYLEKVFGLFEKLNQNIEGTGLGLALVRRIVELNGGTIRVESQGKGQGACFRFTLPRAVKNIDKGVTT